MSEHDEAAVAAARFALPVEGYDRRGEALRAGDLVRSGGQVRGEVVSGVTPPTAVWIRWAGDDSPSLSVAAEVQRIRPTER